MQDEPNFDCINHNTNDDEKRASLSQDAFERYVNDHIEPSKLAHIEKPGSIVIHINTGQLQRSLDQLPAHIQASIDAGMRIAAQRVVSALESTYFLGAEQYKAEERRKLELRMKYGTAWVAEAEIFAEQNGCTFDRAVELLELGERISATLHHAVSAFDMIRVYFASPEVQAAIRSINEQCRAMSLLMTENMAQGIEPSPTANNRHERRVSKHAKPLNEGDQQWKRQNQRKNRSR